MAGLALSALLLAACGVPLVDLPFDSDRDGLLDDEEDVLGTDPALPDSDGDDWIDGDEVGSWTDPLDPDDHPYTGGWPIGACRHSIQGSGWAPGFTAQQFALPDQYGDTVRLHDFCEQAVLLTAYSFT